MGVTVDDARAIAATLPRSYEALVRDQVKFRVGQIVYAAFSRDETIMGFAFPREEREALVGSEPDKFLLPPPSDMRYRWVCVRLDAIDVVELRELLVDAWRMCVPKKVAAAYEGRGAPMSAGGSGSLYGMSEINAIEPDLVDVTTATTAVIRGVVGMADLVGFFDSSFATLAAVLAEQEIAITGAAFALYHGQPTDTADLEVGFVIERAVRPQGGVEAGQLPAGRVARLVHAGGFDQLGESWGRLGAWIDERGLTRSGELWEVYLTEPSPDMDPADLRTELNWLLTT